MGRTLPTASELGDSVRVDISDLDAAIERLERRELVTSYVELAGPHPARRVCEVKFPCIEQFHRSLRESVHHKREDLTRIHAQAPGPAQVALRDLAELLSRLRAVARERRGSVVWLEAILAVVPTPNSDFG